MELREAIINRHSVRGFKDTPVTKEQLVQVLELATRAVSATNSQPWEFAVVTGDILDELKAYNAKAFRSGMKEDREDFPLPDGIYKDRSRTIGKALLGAMEITREDKEGRLWWAERGFRFFDAPAGIILMMDDKLDETRYRLDMGCVIQNICLAAMEQGLGTCVADQIITYHSGIRRILGIPENKIFVTGIAIGYPDEDFKANKVISGREKLENNTTWYGFSKHAGRFG